MGPGRVKDGKIVRYAQAVPCGRQPGTPCVVCPPQTNLNHEVQKWKCMWHSACMRSGRIAQWQVCRRNQEFACLQTAWSSGLPAQRPSSESRHCCRVPLQQRAWCRVRVCSAHRTAHARWWRCLVPPPLVAAARRSVRRVRGGGGNAGRRGGAGRWPRGGEVGQRQTVRRRRQRGSCPRQEEDGCAFREVFVSARGGAEEGAGRRRRCGRW